MQQGKPSTQWKCH